MSAKKSFAYLVRVDPPGPRLLVFDSLDERGFEIPKGAVEASETFEAAALREIREETGIEDARVARELGVTWYEGEEQRFFLLEAPDGLSEAFERTVAGDGIDRGFRYAFRWLAIDGSLPAKLVQGCDAFADSLVETIARRPRSAASPPGTRAAARRRRAPVTSVRNARVVEARKLAQRKHRYRQDRFLVEGLQLLGMAAERMHDPSFGRKVKPRELFYCEDLFVGETAPRLVRSLSEAGAEAIPVAASVLDALSERETSQGLVGTFALHALEWSLDEVRTNVDPAGLILVLDRLQDPGNLGTLIRTADGVGATAVVVLEPSVDPFDPKTVRGTMGSLFTVPVVRLAAASELWPWLARIGHRAVGADANTGEPVWESQALLGPVALVLGNEARGLSEDLRDRLTDSVALPLRGAAESLNVAIAGGVLMYEWLRVNRGHASQRA